MRGDVNLRQTTALALMCAEWDGALTHLRALHQVGCRVPETVMRSVIDEATDYTALWSGLNGEWWTYEQSVASARAWLTEHQDVMEDLLARDERAWQRGQMNHERLR